MCQWERKRLSVFWQSITTTWRYRQRNNPSYRTQKKFSMIIKKIFFGSKIYLKSANMCMGSKTLKNSSRKDMSHSSFLSFPSSFVISAFWLIWCTINKIWANESMPFFLFSGLLWFCPTVDAVSTISSNIRENWKLAD
jgi:hypothetical protein